MKKIFSLFILFMLNNSAFAFAETMFHLERNVASYINDYSYDEKDEAHLSSLICGCMSRFDALENLIKAQGFSATGSEGILIANYSLAYLTMDVYSLAKETDPGGAERYIGKANSYESKDVRKIHADYQLVSSAISEFIKNNRVAVNELSSVTDTGCYYVYVYRNNQSESWLVPVEVFQDPGIIEGTFFEPALDVIIDTQ